MYIDGFVAAVPKANKQAYMDHLKEAVVFFKEYGATRMVENWGDDVPRGKVNDFYGAVHAKEEEIVVFSWVEWPSKEARNIGMEKMMSDERMAKLEFPFDGKRVIYGGFETIFDQKL